MYLDRAVLLRFYFGIDIVIENNVQIYAYYICLNAEDADTGYN